MGLSWWHRIWTVQEAVLPKTATITCGSLEIPFSILGAACINLFKHNNVGCCDGDEDLASNLDGFYLVCNNIELLRTTNQPSYPFAILLTMFRSRVATDERDKVFALPGLLPADTRLSRSTNYSPDWRNIYQATTRRLIQETNDVLPLIRPAELD
jgi:hypothetical protein